MSKLTTLLRGLAVASLTLLFSVAHAQPAPYGTPITLEAATKLAVGATAEARKNNWPVVISIVDSAGQLVLLHRLDNTQYASLDIATGKAKTAVNFRRTTKALEDVIAGGGAGLRFLRVDGMTPLEGGIPIIVDGKIVGGVGVSGVTSQQDAQIAQAGINALLGK
ncbi:MAG: GlcG/HbpS family heme-binding protein [Burkholderiales bacterium]